ncbi:hypothetical protein CDL15_Pgr014140 [Punica granatum]|uniref:Uncharacterized protein n=1 Tax=Punica granatum TaxID=22663 RepID=A0A218Y177_PUNGR|nr:hypothetical protein CDL15_Pgr014140 [Punica granatum]
MATAEGGQGSFSGRRCDRASDFYGGWAGSCSIRPAGGQGHALFVGAVACDLFRMEGWNSVSKFQGAGREVFIVLIVVVQGSSYLLVSYFLQWEEEKQ